MKRSVRVRSKGNRTFHAAVGIRSMPPDQIAQNIDAVLQRLLGKLERGRYEHRIRLREDHDGAGPVRIW